MFVPNMTLSSSHSRPPKLCRLYSTAGLWACASNSVTVGHRADVRSLNCRRHDA